MGVASVAAESASALRVLLLGDTHIGFDHPLRPRVKRRRRGPDFLANFHRALDPARQGRVDLVVHAGDVFHRSKVAPQLVELAFAPLIELADAGLPVIVVPGNHERSRIPHPLLVRHPRIHVFDSAGSQSFDIGGARVAIGAFPYHRRIRRDFRDQIRCTGIADVRADIRLLVMHHCFEGATVAAHDYVFRDAPDVVAAHDVPAAKFAAVLSGHIHRHQVLSESLSGRTLAAPVVYAGSVERTSVAERLETKGFMTLNLEPCQGGGRVRDWRFHPLPTRTMVLHRLRGGTRRELLRELEELLARVPQDAVLKLQVPDDLPESAARVLGAGHLREMACATVNVDVAWPRGLGRAAARRRQG